MKPVPDEDYRYYINAEKMGASRSRFFTIGGAIVLLITAAIMIAFTFNSFIMVRQLKQEIEILKSSVKELKSIVREDLYDDLYTEDPEDNRTAKSRTSNESDYDNYYDYDVYDDGEDQDDDILNDIIITEEDIHRLLTGGQFTKDAKSAKDIKRKRRSVIGYTEDGVPINSESFAEARRRNVTLRRKQPHPHPHPSTYPPLHRSSYPLTPNVRLYEEMERWGSTTPGSPVYSRRNRVMHQEDKSKAFRQVVKKSSLKSGDQHRSSEENPDSEFTIVRDDQIGGGRGRHRHVEGMDERRPRIGRMRPLPTAHYSGDTSKYVLGQHVNFNGNGHLKHLQQTYVDWVESSWVRTLGMDRHYSMVDGVLTIKEPGLYFVYAQIYYLDEHDTNGFRVYKNEATLLQCTTMTHSVDREGDRISLRDLSESRYSLFEPGKSFFGIIKLGDVKIK